MIDKRGFSILCAQFRKVRMTEDKIYTFFDANGVRWDWNGYKVYVPLTEEELKKAGIPEEQNGYYADSLENALDILADGGYMERE
jgi:hypothetical protein